MILSDFVFSAVLDSSFERSAINLLEGANLISLTKKVFEDNKNVRIQVVVSTDDSLEEVSGERLWPEDGYFRSQVTDCNIEKVNYTENTLFYINKAFLTIQKAKKMYYGNHL